jgi:hypothetical protein
LGGNEAKATGQERVIGIAGLSLMEVAITPSASYSEMQLSSVLVVGCWLLVVGCWLLVVGCWLWSIGYI